eukprot:TRINITY_DN6_c0_g1_i1.p1 TRINITY_DN6_c0_g1~~TRINITY_DN6_c0_g1_i1.p1  ORF type:complete len:1683 (+),score=564.52 TRINITY_DN6_c0_g1_i1:139-5187(+)
MRTAVLLLLAPLAAQGAYQGWRAAEVVPGGHVWGLQEFFSGPVDAQDDCFEKAVKYGAKVVQWHAGTSTCILYSDALPGVCGAFDLAGGPQCIADPEYQLFVQPTETPSPTTDVGTQSSECGGACIAASIVLACFYGVMLSFLVWFFRDEWSWTTRRTNIAKQIKQLKNQEENRNVGQPQRAPSPKRRENQEDVTKAIKEAAAADLSLPQNAWMAVRRYDASDTNAVGEERFKTWPEFLNTRWVQDKIRDGPAGHEETIAEMKEYFTELPDIAERDELERWAIKEIENDEKPWEEMNALERVEHVGVVFFKFVGIWCVLYLFIVALGLMGDSFKLVGGRTSGRTFRDAEVIANPVAGICIGILATVLMQSSSTTTSIVISMAAADLVTVKDAAFLVMGANIGTSVTNTIVSLAHINTPDEYRRAFAGATFHDMFNWVTVLVFCPLEIASDFLIEIAGAAVNDMGLSNTDKQGKVDFIKKIISPAQGRLISVDKGLITKIAAAEDSDEVSRLEKLTMIKQKSGHAFRDSPIGDDAVGGLLIFVSLSMLCVCLLMLVRLLQSVLKGKVALWSRFLLNLEFENCLCQQLGGLDNYILLAFGTGCTILVQSSSVFTSTITPLVGIGLIHIEKLVPLTHGANLGTTVTGVLSALTNSNIVIAMQVALTHVFFNSLGTCLWFVVWPLRPLPLAMCKFMGSAAAQLNWFPLAYIVVCFLVGPVIVFGVSVPGWESSVGVLVPLATLFVSIALIAYMRRNYPEHLPACLKCDQLCGRELPNWLRVERDASRDAADIAEMKRAQEADLERKRKLKWPYGPFVWGAGILALLALFLALPTSQWRRVWYDGEPTRKEWGIGLWEVCQKDFGKDMIWLKDPAPKCTPAAVRAWLSDQPPPADPKHKLIRQCESNSSFGDMSPFSWPQHKWTADIYSDAWAAIRSSLKCSAEQWEDACIAMGTAGGVCAGRSSHRRLCHWPSGHWVKRSGHGTKFTSDFSRHRAVSEVIPKPVSNGFPDGAADTDSVLYSLAWPMDPVVGAVQPSTVQWRTMVPPPSCHGASRSAGLCSDAPAASGISWSPCSGELLLVSGAAPRRSCPTRSGEAVLAGSDAAPWQPAIRRFSMRPDTFGSPWARLSYPGGAAAESRPHAAHAGAPQFTDGACTGSPLSADPAGITLGSVAELPGGARLGADLSGPKLVVFNAAGTVTASYVPQGSTAYDGLSGVHKVLPASFARALQSARAVGVGSVAVDATFDPDQKEVRAFACLSRPLAGRLLRCAVLDVTDTAAPKLLKEKVVLQTAAPVEWTAAKRGVASAQDDIRTVGGSWLGRSEVAVAETTTVAGATGAAVIAAIDFATGDDVGSISGDLEGLSAAAGQNSDPIVALTRAGAAPMALHLLVDAAHLSNAAAISRVSGIAVPNKNTVVIATDNQFGASAQGLTQIITVNTEHDLGDAEYECPTTQYAKAWSKQKGDPVDGQLCKQISDWCPGSLQKDMEGVAGTATAGTACHGLGVLFVIYWLFLGDRSRLGVSPARVLLAAAAFWSLGWLFLLAAWARLLSMEETEYSCPFVHDSGKGAVMLTGKLADITDQSYSWALAIFSWSLITLTLPFVVAKAVSANRAMGQVQDAPSSPSDADLEEQKRTGTDAQNLEVEAPNGGAPEVVEAPAQPPAVVEQHLAAKRHGELSVISPGPVSP